MYVASCSGLSQNGPLGFSCLNAQSRLFRTGSCGLVGGSVSLRVAYGVSMLPSLSLPVVQHVALSYVSSAVRVAMLSPS